jgi:hypothetical protein
MLKHDRLSLTRQRIFVLSTFGGKFLTNSRTTGLGSIQLVHRFPSRVCGMKEAFAHLWQPNVHTKRFKIRLACTHLYRLHRFCRSWLTWRLLQSRWSRWKCRHFDKVNRIACTLVALVAECIWYVSVFKIHGSQPITTIRYHDYMAYKPTCPTSTSNLGLSGIGVYSCVLNDNETVTF